jgi:hypothetical protein
MTTRVVNMTSAKRFDVRIDRATKWGNPFYVGRHGSRQQVIERYETYIRNQPDLMAALSELKGKTLGCWCKPLPCHGDVLARLAEEVP